MKRVFSIFLILLLVAPGCDIRKRERALQLKEAELKQREQELLLRDESLQLKEAELAQKEKRLDSSSSLVAADTLSALHPYLPGLWNVTMRCNETTCAGSAVGDTKTEQWDMSIQGNAVIAKAMSNKTLLRIYSGIYVNNSFVLNAQQDSVTAEQAVKIVVRLQPVKENEMTGQREISRQDNCRIVYALELKKQ